MNAQQKKITVKEIGLVWLVVEDFEKALHFYTDVLGLKLEERNDDYGWAELSGINGGARLGIAKNNDMNSIKPGQNAIVTLTVDNISELLVPKGSELPIQAVA